MRRLCGEAALIAAWLLQVDGLLSDLWPGRVHIGMPAGVHLPKATERSQPKATERWVVRTLARREAETSASASSAQMCRSIRDIINFKKCHTTKSARGPR